MLIAAWQQWVGINSRMNPRLLAPGMGVDAVDFRPGSGDLRPWNLAPVVHALAGLGSQAQSIHRMGKTTPNDNSFWLTSLNDVDYVRSLVALDTAERTYYTGETEPRVTDTTLAIAGAPYPTSYRTLGVPAPDAAPVANETVVGSAANFETRAYLDTFVTDRGEESAPNPAVTSIKVKTNSTVTLTDLAPPPAGAHGITLRRVYVSTGGEYKQVAQIAAGAGSVTDNGTVRGTVLASGGSTSRPAWLVPPADMRGLIGLWNGMMGAFQGKRRLVCEPFQPHAWPLEYQRPVFDDIVASATWGQNWLLLTNGRPVLVQGNSPLSLLEQPLEFLQACVSKRSAVGVGHGVCWASPDGLCYVGNAGPSRVITEGLLTPEQWRAMNPSSIRGVRYESWYMGFYTQAGVRKGFMIDPANPVGLIHLTQGAVDAWFDETQDALYLLDEGNTIRKWNAGGAGTVSFTTGVVRHGMPTNPGVLKVEADAYPVTVTLYADGVQRWTKAVASDAPQRLPGGYMAQNFQAKVTGPGCIAVTLADSVGDLP